ncbi:tetratricopeptide repeat protein [Sphingomonas mesophila]|uniref:tetratricopeptide repeat protein n=1 Tax=Sphingomonas mesophila TaxID=2303576 RepID=UPI000E56F1B8|nr:SEL1-like repeat protein [Sphingomonas mesophila]
MRNVLRAAFASLVLLAACSEARPTPPLIVGLQKLAAANDAEAMYHLGMAYHTGSGLAEDPAKALAAFRRSAQLGDPLGAYKLGCYYDGQGGDVLEPDAELALRYKLVAAKAGYALAQQDVAKLYAGRRDFAVALDWLERATAQGWPDALMTYASIHNGADGITPDAVKTTAYFRLFLNSSEASDEQRRWLRDFEKKLSAAQRAQADALVRGFRPEPTVLTLKALSGQRAAEALVARRR